MQSGYIFMLYTPAWVKQRQSGYYIDLPGNVKTVVVVVVVFVERVCRRTGVGNVAAADVSAAAVVAVAGGVDVVWCRC